LRNALEKKLQRIRVENQNLRLLDAILSVKKPQDDSNRTRIQLMTRMSELQQQESSLWKHQQQQQQQDVIKKYLSQQFL